MNNQDAIVMSVIAAVVICLVAAGLWHEHWKPSEILKVVGFLCFFMAIALTLYARSNRKPKS